MNAPAFLDPFGGPAVQVVEGWITDALDLLGVDSDEVAAALAANPVVRRQPGIDPVCVYLQDFLDPAGTAVQVVECDARAVTFAVLNPDGCTWTHAVTVLPWPVWVFCCRADDGDFPQFQVATLDGGR